MSRQEKVRIVVEANTEAAKALGAALNDAFQKAGSGAENMSRRGKSGFDGMMASADKFIFKLVGVQTAAEAALKAATAALNEQQRLREASVDPTVRMDTGVRRYLQTAQMGMKAYSPVERMFMEETRRLGVPFDTVAALGEALKSADVSHQAIAGGGLRAAVEGWAAMNLQGSQVDPQAHGKAIGMMMTGMALPSTAENVARVNRVLFSAKTRGNVEISQLPHIAGVAGTVRMMGGLGLEEQMAAITALSQQGGTDEMTTAFKNAVVQLGGLGNHPEKVRALREMGLKPTDVDMVGENFFSAISRLHGGLKGMPEERRNLALGRLFGEKTIRAPVAMFEAMGTIANIQAGMADEQGFKDAVGIAGSGAAAEFRKVQAEEDFAARLGGFQTEMSRRRRAAARAEDLHQGENLGVPGFRTVNKVMGDYLDRWFGSIMSLKESMDAQRESADRLRTEGIKVELTPDVQAKPAQPARGQQNSVWGRLKAGFSQLDDPWTKGPLRNAWTPRE